jgi:dihydrofolate reductase
VSFDVVVAADLDWGIGKTNGIPWPRLRGDLAHFKRVTTTAREGLRNAIVMGRRTWESREVAGKPLPKRLNVVVSRRALAVPDGVIAVTSLDAAIAAARADATVDGIFVLGGGEIYRRAFADPRLGHVYLTRVEGRFGCDITIPDLDALGFVPDAWDGACIGEDNEVRYRIERMRRP